MVADSDATEFQAVLDPPYRRLRELAAARQAEEADGGVRWLNLPLPGYQTAMDGWWGPDWRTALQATWQASLGLLSVAVVLELIRKLY